LNIQTEHLENHTARLTVEVDQDRLQKAMQDAARRISKKGRIPGFRPGKAPMSVVLNLYGREYVLSEALDKLGNDIYREALDASEIEPYASGTLEDVKEEDGLRLIFVVPLRPTVDLADYRAIRADYEVQEVTDEMVSEAMENLRQEQALLEPVERPAKMGDQVKFSHIDVVVLKNEDDEDDENEEEVEEETDDAEESDEGDDAENDAEDDDFEDDFGDEWDDVKEVLIHQHDYDRVLRDDKDDLFPGFSAQLVGVNIGDQKTFELSIPEDYDQEELAGRTLRCDVSVSEVQARTVPEWTDDLAKRLSEDKFETMLELRMDLRKQLEQYSEEVAKDNLAGKALEQLVEGATIRYPEELIQEYIDDLLQSLDDNLRQRGLRLEDFMKLTGRTQEDLRKEYRDTAVERAERALALGELVRREELVVDDSAVDAEIEAMSTMLGGDEQAGRFKQFLMTPESRFNIGNRLVANRAMERLAAIAKGENPPIGPAVVEAEAQSADEAAVQPVEEVAADEAQPTEEAGAQAGTEVTGEPESETSES
jgi:trigger factor